MKKKVILILLTICMMLSMLACGASGDAGVESEGKDEVQEVVKENPKTLSEHFSRQEAKVWFVAWSFEETSWPKSVIVVQKGNVKVYDGLILERIYQMAGELPNMGRFSKMSDKEIVAELEKFYDAYMKQLVEKEKPALAAIRSQVAEWTAQDDGAKVSAWIERGSNWQYYVRDEKYIIPVSLINEYESMVDNYAIEEYPVASLTISLHTDEAGNLLSEKLLFNYQTKGVDFWADQFVSGGYKPHLFAGNFEITGKEQMGGRMYYDVYTVNALQTTEAQMVYNIVGVMEKVNAGNTSYAGYVINEMELGKRLWLVTACDKNTEFLLDEVKQGE